MGIDIINQVEGTKTAAILLDNQAAPCAIDIHKPRPGQQLIALFHHTLGLLREQEETQFTLFWVPGHSGIVGNEAMDCGAKEAVQGASSDLPEHLLPLLHLPKSAAATKAAYKKSMAKEWAQLWIKSPHRIKIAKFDKFRPGKHTIKMYRGLTKRQTSIITQLRSGHIGLNYYLSRFKIVDSPLCTTCKVAEKVDHYLTKCRQYNDLRFLLRRNLRKAHITTTNLLGTRKHWKEVLEFVDGTKRLLKYLSPEG